MSAQRGDTLLTILRVAGGRVEAAYGGKDSPIFELRLGNEALARTRVGDAGPDGTRLVHLAIPAHVIADGVQVLEIVRGDDTVPLASVLLVAGQPYEEDLHAQVALLRAELDQVKALMRRKFRP